MGPSGSGRMRVAGAEGGCGGRLPGRVRIREACLARLPRTAGGGGRAARRTRLRAAPRARQPGGRSRSYAPRAIGARTASVSAARSPGASSTSRPRRPADTHTVACADAESSRTVRSRLRCPSGEMPPRT